MSMKTNTTTVNRVCRAAFAVLLAVGMSWPCGLAFADDDADGSTNEPPQAENTQPEPSPQPDNPSSDPTPEGNVDGGDDAPAAEETASGEAAPDTSSSDSSGSTPSESDATSSETESWGPEQILKAAREAGLAGVDALAKWLSGATLTDEEMVSIDVAGLAEIDPDLASQIEPLQEEARQRLADAAEDEKSGKDKDSDGDDKKKKDDSDESEYPAWTYKGDTGNPPTFHGPSLETAKFVAVIGESARKLAGENDLYASVMIAQAIAESESGSSALSKSPNYNLFGMEGDYHGDSVSVKEQDDKSADYKKYPSYEAALQDYVDLLSGKDYAPARKPTAKSYADACDYLEGTYSDSKSYSEDLQELISAYDLTRYDEPLGFELADGGDANLADLTISAADNLGKPYVWGATGPDGYDCSGLVVSTYSSVLGTQLPRTTYFQCQIGEDVDFADLHTGDLLFFTNSKNEACHVAMYVGEGCYIESTSPGGVQVTALSENMPAFAKRMIPTRAV